MSSVHVKETDLIVVGTTSGVYKHTTANAPVIPNFPIMLNVILTGTSDIYPANNTIFHVNCESSGVIGLYEVYSPSRL